MKLYQILVITIACLTLTCEAQAPSECLKKRHSTAISEIPPEGIIINTPGVYVFNNDITWGPTGDENAVLITSPDVTLDLQGYTLASETTTFRTAGIAAIGATNLTIRNGTILNMGLEGINCSLCSDLSIKEITVDGLNMANTAVFTVPAGILASTSLNVFIHKCTVKNLNVETASLAAIQLTGVINSIVSDCTIDNLLNRDGACSGIGHLLCSLVTIKRCTINNLKSEFIDNLNTEGHTTIGIIPVSSENILVKDCKVSNVVGCCDDAHGISIFECQRATVRGCHVDGVLDGAGAAQTGAKATGIEIYASYVNVIKCKVKNIQAINPQNKQATGFSCAQGTNVSFIKCEAENVTVVDENGNENPNLGFGTGFGWAPDPRPSLLQPAINVLYSKCKAKNCQVGFDSWYHINSHWENIKSVCNQIPILIEPNGTRTLSCDACSECGCTQIGCYPTPLIVTIQNVASGNTFTGVKERGCN